MTLVLVILGIWFGLDLGILLGWCLYLRLASHLREHRCN